MKTLVVLTCIFATATAAYARPQYDLEMALESLDLQKARNALAAGADVNILTP